MAESLEHQLLAEDLADLLSMAGFAVVRRDAAGCRRPPLIRGCRPDLVAWHLIRPDHVVGEAKLGADLFTVRSLEQYVAFSSAPLPLRPAMRAHLVLAVPGDHALLAWRALALAGADAGRVTVAARLSQRWLITSRPLAGAGLWPRFAVATPNPSSSCVAPSTLGASAGGDFTGAISQGDQT